MPDPSRFSKATEYLDSDPILWVPSEIFCDFMIRKIEELRFIQVRFFKEPRSNYGIMTSIIVHLLRNVSFAVPAKHTHLTEALRDLTYEGVIQRFGMLFLQDLNPLTGELPVITQVDNADVAHRLRACVKKVGKPRNPAGLHLTHENTEPTMEYPLGEWPTWNELVHCLENNPIHIMQSWRWTSLRTWDDYASELFLTFTNDMWLAVAPVRFRNPPHRASTLQEAVESWSVSHVANNFLSVRFLPNSHGLNKKTKRCCDFADLLNVFFPQVDTLPQDAVWMRFAQRHGYLHMYSEFQASLSDEHVQNIDTNLAALLRHAQCLPNSTKATDSMKGSIWTGSSGTVHMRTNSTCYRLKGVGSAKSTARKVMRINLPSQQVVTRIDEAQGISMRASKVRQRKEKRSAKSRNKRIPPPVRVTGHGVD